MQVGCTQKLLTYLKKEPTPVQPELDPFYSWTATLLTLHRHKTIVVVHDASRCGFVLYGVTSKMLKNLNQLLLEGMQAMLEEEGIAPDVVQKYLQDGGATLCYTKTKDRSAVARLNKFSENVEFRAEKLCEDTLLQPQLLCRLNDDMIHVGKEYRFTRQLLRDEFAAHYPNQTVFACPMVTLDIRLHLKTPCHRRVRMPLRQSLHEFHNILQILFGWKAYHLHEFVLEPGQPLEMTMPQYSQFAQLDDWGNTDAEPMEWCISLAEVLEQYPHFWYVYDYGDDWEHEITLVSRETDTEFSAPQCILAVGDAPPENVGGPDGYAALQELLKYPARNGYAEAKRWLEESGWKPLNMEELQEKLRTQGRLW